MIDVPKAEQLTQKKRIYDFAMGTPSYKFTQENKEVIS